MARVCANCGTEVDDDALFCPTCGEPLEHGGEPDLPPAPDWPASSSGATPAAASAREESAPPPSSPLTSDSDPDWAPTRSMPEPAAMQPAQSPMAEPEPIPEAPRDGQAVPPWRRGAAYRAGTPPTPEPSQVAAPRPGALRPEGILRPPETLAGWLIGIGAFVGVVAMLLPWVVAGTYTGSWGLASGINLLFTIVLIAVLVAVFLPHVVPAIPQRNLTLLAITLIGVGLGLDRLGLPLTGTGAMIFLIGMLAGATGAFLAQLGMDRPVGGPQR
jgi:zinc-ribbon domain